MSDEREKAQKAWQHSIKAAMPPAEELRDQLAKFTQPAYLKGFQAAMAGITDSSYLTQMRASLAAIANPPYLAQMREQMAAIANPPYLKLMREQVAAITKPRHLFELREQIASIANLPEQTRMREQISVFTDPARVADLLEKMASIPAPNYVTQIREQLAAMPDGFRMQTEMSAALVSYEEFIKKSSLARFLVDTNGPDKPPAQGVSVQGFDSLQISDFVTLEIDQDADREIVKAIAEGDTARLSPPMMQRFIMVYFVVIAIWDMFIRIMDTYAAYLALVAVLTNVSVPADIPKQAAVLPIEQRLLLADYRIVNREAARLRAEPSKVADVLVQLHLGTPVEVLEKRDTGWFHVSVEYNGDLIEGWIYVSVTTAVPLPKSARGQNVDVTSK